MPINVSKSACWGQKTHLGRTEAMKIDVYEIACIWRKGTGYVVLSLSLSPSGGELYSFNHDNNNEYLSSLGQ